MGVFHTWFTVILLLMFIGIVLWAYSSRRKQDFEEAARLPLDDDMPDQQGGGS